jgi:hypothetical protein
MAKTTTVAAKATIGGRNPTAIAAASTAPATKLAPTSPATPGEGAKAASCGARASERDQFEEPTMKEVCAKFHTVSSARRRDQPNEIVFTSHGKIVGRWNGFAVGMRMIAAHDVTLRIAQDSQQAKLLRRIDFEAIGTCRQIARGMQTQHFDDAVASHTLNQAATFARIRGIYFGDELLPEIRRQVELKNRGAMFDVSLSGRT